MKLRLVRRDYRKDGVFGELTDMDDNHICFTLERAYCTNEGSIFSKIKSGEYVCKKGMHRLPNMTEDFETFEITDVPGHWGILFHVGNYNEDSEGCVLVGEGLGNRYKNGVMLTHSKKAFAKLMALLKDVESFDLIVLN